MQSMFIRKGLDLFQGQLTEVEQWVSAAEDILRYHYMSLHMLKIKLKLLEACAEDSTNCNRRNDLRILGLPKVLNPMIFTDQLLTRLLPNTLSLHSSLLKGLIGSLLLKFPWGHATHHYFLITAL